MIKKIVVLIGVLFIITGCSVNYNITINNNSIDEEIIINNVTFDLQDYSIYYDVDGFSESGEKLSNVHYYEKNKIGSVITYSNKFDWKNYNRSRAARTCLKSISLSRSDENIILSTSTGFSCFNQFTNMNSININVRVNEESFDVVSSNADNNTGSIYTWIINSDNFESKYIQLLFHKKANQNSGTEIENKENTNQNNFWLIMGAVVIGMILVISLGVNLNSRKR